MIRIAAKQDSVCNWVTSFKFHCQNLLFDGYQDSVLYQSMLSVKVACLIENCCNGTLLYAPTETLNSTISYSTCTLSH